MKVREVMTAGAQCITPDQTLQEAARMMKNLDVGPLPVCDNDRLVGILTDRDITVRATAEGQDPKRTRVADILTPDVVFCFDDQDVHDAARLMQENQIRRLVVLNRDKRLVGIVSLGDLAVDAAKGHDRQVAQETLERVSEPAAPKK